MNEVLHLSINTKGRDILVGDIHGSFDLLKKALKAIGFNKDTDRLICAGDLVDRGIDSARSAKFVEQPFVYSVIGNHDAMFCFQNKEYLFKKEIMCSPFDDWFCQLTESELQAFCTLFHNKLYPAIEIETKNGLVGVVHAEVPDDLTWAEFRERINKKDYDLFHKAMWSRIVAKDACRLIRENDATVKKLNEEYTITDISHVFHGHTPSTEFYFKNYSIGNRHYIDTKAYDSAVSKYASLTLFDINNPKEPLISASY